jgi:hypothetical protein
MGLSPRHAVLSDSPDGLNPSTTPAPSPVFGRKRRALCIRRSPVSGVFLLKVRETGWTIAGIHHSLKGESVFRLEVVAKILRS